MKYMIKVIKHLLKSALGSEEDFTFEERLVMASLLFSAMATFVSAIINICLHLGLGSIILVITLFIFLVFLYVLSRIYRKTYLAKLLMTICLLVFCNFYWYMNYGSIGSGIYVFLMYFIIMFFTWETIQVRIIGLLVMLNILALFVFELNYPDFIPNYPSEQARIIDTYGTLFILLGFMYMIVLNARNNYVKQYKMAQKSDKLKSAFLANMSHEIRTPLNAIMGFSQLLAEHEPTKEIKERYSKIITDNGDYLMKLISDIMDISMIESDQLNIVINKVNLNNLFQDIYNTQEGIMNKMQNNDVRLILKIPTEQITIETDEMRLKQVIHNLIGNAIKFTSKGHIKIGFTPDNGKVLFFIEDTGSGIKEEFQPEVFNRFVRNEDSNEVRMTRGAGIGLSLSKELVNFLGGKIWFTSSYMEGTTFYFSIPLNYFSGKTANTSKN